MSKKLRQCDRLNLLIVSCDEEFINDVRTSFPNLNILKVATQTDDILKLCEEYNFDTVVVDKEDESFVPLLNKINKLKIVPAKIVILNSFDNAQVTDAINSNVYNMLVKPFNMLNLKLSIMMSVNQTQRNDKIKLGKGFYFDIYRDRVYNKNGKVVELTKLELGLLKLLIENRGNIVNYDLIEEKVWQGKKMSIFTMRNIVNKLRSKLFYNVFHNSSSKGYILT